MMDDAKRLALVRDLLEASRPLPELARDLARLPWDFEGVGLRLEAAYIRSILQRYLAGELRAGQVEEWANLVECRDDVVFEGASSGTLRVLHELANPLVTRSLTAAGARSLLLLLD